MELESMFTDPSNRIKRLEGVVEKHVGGGINYLVRHKNYFVNRPEEEQLLVIGGTLFITGVAMICSSAAAEKFDWSATKKTITVLSGAAVGFTGSTLGYMQYTEGTPEYAALQARLARDALIREINEVYEKDEVLCACCCPIFNTIMLDPVFLPHDPKVLKQYKADNMPELYVCDKSSLQINHQTKKFKHPTTNYIFDPSELVEDHETAVRVHKRLRHLLTSDLSSMPESSSPTRQELVKYLTEIEANLEKHYQDVLTKLQTLTLAKPQNKEEFAKISLLFQKIGMMDADPWAVEPEIQNRVEQAHPVSPRQGVGQKKAPNPSTDLLEALASAGQIGAGILGQR